jgi:hypothetical protein
MPKKGEPPPPEDMEGPGSKPAGTPGRPSSAYKDEGEDYLGEGKDEARPPGRRGSDPRMGHLDTQGEYDPSPAGVSPGLWYGDTNNWIPPTNYTTDEEYEVNGDNSPRKKSSSCRRGGNANNTADIWQADEGETDEMNDDDDVLNQMLMSGEMPGSSRKYDKEMQDKYYANSRDAKLHVVDSDDELKLQEDIRQQKLKSLWDSGDID